MVERKNHLRISFLILSSFIYLINILAWDQSDKFIKIYVQNLDGVGNLPNEQIHCSFEDR